MTSLTELLASARNQGDRDLLDRLLCFPSSWPDPSSDTHALALAIAPDGPPASAPGETVTATVAQGRERASLWQLRYSSSEPGVPLVEQAEQAFRNGHSALLRCCPHLLGRHGVPGPPLAVTIHRTGTGLARSIDGSSVGLAAALSSASIGFGVPLRADTSALARIGVDGGVLPLGRDEELLAKLALLRDWAPAIGMLLVAEPDVLLVDRATASWERPVEVIPVASLNEALSHVLPPEVLEEEPGRPRTAWLPEQTRRDVGRWRRETSFEARHRLWVDHIAPAFAPQFESLPLFDPDARPRPDLRAQVSVLGLVWQPAALLARWINPRRLLLIGTKQSFDYVDGDDPVDLIARFSRVDRRLIQPLPVDAHDETKIYEAVRDFVEELGLRPDQVALDPTGGKKSMSAAAALAGFSFGMPLLYVDSLEYSPQRRAPVPGTEYPRRLRDPRPPDRSDGR